MIFVRSGACLLFSDHSFFDEGRVVDLLGDQAEHVLRTPDNPCKQGVEHVEGNDRIGFQIFF